MPNLIVISGCNGAGKSTFATSFLPEGLISFDYDRIFLEHYNSLPDSELREKFAKDQTSKEFETIIEESISKKKDFCYETNFDSYPIFWPQKFKENGYKLNLIFFCLADQDVAKHRIQVRTEFKGHFVDNKTIELKWKAGYKNVNLHYNFFDNVLFVDNSKQNDVYTNILQVEKGEMVLMIDQVPDYFKHRLPEIYKLISKV
ncbi:zeta toxin family protein [Belliella marina]|uniref:Zeta toxin family protein n=1 Tax=Belliella marina TaxID=1644146 RepID=A0ABW4VLR0_9BACT